MSRRRRLLFVVALPEGVSQTSLLSVVVPSVLSLLARSPLTTTSGGGHHRLRRR